MDHYVDLHLRPDPEIAPGHLMNILFSRFHLALVKSRDSNIAVSFPQVSEKAPNLGHNLRIHSSTSVLSKFMKNGWLAGMGDYLKQSDITVVPAETHHRCIKRVQAKSSPERLRRRLMKRHNMGLSESRKQIPDTAIEMLSLPFLILSSASTGQQFRLFIRHGPILVAPVFGLFNSYGLSQNATVPWF